MNNSIYGYVRVSSKDQNEARQMNAMAEHQIPQKHIFMDKQSGKDFERVKYKKLLRKKAAIPLLLRVSTVWAKTMMKSWSNGGSSLKKSRWQ